jgi:hypothetical protein
MPAQAGVDDRERTIVEVAHKDDRMMQVLAQQDRVAEHSVPLIAPLPHSQSKMTVENVEHRP